MTTNNEFRDWLVVIPARLQAVRLPRKPLQDLCGKPLIVRVYENLAPLAQKGATLIVATDHQDILDVCAQHGVQATLTSSHHTSGTERCFEVAKQHTRSLVMNVQGDEPFIGVPDLEALMRMTAQDSRVEMSTLVFTTAGSQEWTNPNVVKAVISADNHALYFSRAPIPHHREPAERTPTFYRHLGVYAFRKDALQRFCLMAPGALEQTEKLEQLRALENNMRIKVHLASTLSIGIDTPEDLEAARAYFQR